MKFTTTGGSLAEVLGEMQLPASRVGVAGTGLLLMEVEGGSLKLTVSDRELTVSRSIAANIDESGKATVNSRRLHAIVSSLGNGMINFQNKGNKMLLHSGGAKASLALSPDGEFPEEASQSIGTIEAGMTVDANEFLKSVNMVGYAAATEGVNYHFMGVYLHPANGAVKMAATDGRRLSVTTLRVEQPPATEKWSGGIVPTRTLDKVLKVLRGGDGEVDIVLSDGAIQLTWTGGRISSRLIAGQFPQYAVLLDKAKTSSEIVLKRAEVLEAIRRAARAGSGLGGKIVTLSIGAVGEGNERTGVVEVSLPEGLDGTYSETLTLDFVPEIARKISFMADYLLQPLGALEDSRVALRIAGETDAVLLDAGERLLAVLAPVVGQE